MTENATAKPCIPLWRRSGFRELALIALLAEIAYAVLNISTMPVYLKFDRQFGESVIALVLASFLLCEAVFKGPMGQLADRFGCRRLMVIGPTLSVGTSLLSLVVPHHIGGFETLAFIVLRALDGLGAAMLWPAAFALAGNSVADNERQEAMSLLNSCYLLGIALALPIGGTLETILNSKATGLYLAAGMFALVAIASLRFVPSDSRPKHEVLAEHGDFKVNQIVETARQIPQYLILAVVTFAGIGFPMAIVKLFAKEQFEMSGAAFGALVFPVAIAMAGLSVPMARMGERMGRARAVHVGLGLCALGLGVISLGAFFPAFRSAWILMLGGIPVGLGFLLTIPAWLASVSDIDPKRRAINLGAVMTAQGVGAIVGMMLGGPAYEKLQAFGADFGRYSPFLGCTLCVTIGWVVSLRILHPGGVGTAGPESPSEGTLDSGKAEGSGARPN